MRDVIAPPQGTIEQFVDVIDATRERLFAQREIDGQDTYDEQDVFLRAGMLLTRYLDEVVTPDNFVESVRSLNEDCVSGTSSIDEMPTPPAISQAPGMHYLHRTLAFNDYAERAYGLDFANSIRQIRLHQATVTDQ